MSVTGPAGPSLTARLQEKLRQDREQIEALTLSELRKLAESLSASSRDALDAMREDTDERLALMRGQMERIERQQRRWPLWTALACATIAGALFALLWMATSWARSDLRAALIERYEARQVLELLRDETKGVSMGTSADGTFLVLPEGADPRWTCGESACVKLPE